MSHLEFLRVFGYFILTTIACLSSGSWVLSKLDHSNKKMPSLPLHYGLSILIGMGLLGNGALLLGLLGIFNKTNLLIWLAIMTVSGASQLLRKIQVINYLSLKFHLIIFKKPIVVIPLFLSLITTFTLYLSAMAPPISSDELHYHFPEAREIVNSNRIDLAFGGHYFYGNIPKFMEIVFATGLEIQGYSLAHAYNLLILLAFCMLLYGSCSTIFGETSGAITVLAVLWFSHFTWNATVGFIDTATVSYEIASLLLLFVWNKRREGIYLITAGILSGIAFSIKYSPAPTYLFEIILLLYWLKKDWKKIFIFLSATAIFCGFWYGKNFIYFGNPFYPLYFGHKGVTDDVYLILLSAIQQFEPKIWSTFWNLLSPYRSITQGNVLALLLISPFVIFMKKYRVFSIPLLVYLVLYLNYWFFLGTHQVRFLAPALVVAQILGGLVLSRLSIKQLTLLVVIGFLYPMFSLGIPTTKLWSEIWATRLHIVERQYALGNISENEFLHRNFGCQYDVIAYLSNNKLDGAVIDNWSIWHAPSVSYYSTHNGFTSSTPEAMSSGQVKYIYFSDKVKEEHLADTDQTVANRREPLLKIETELLKTAKLIYEKDDCKLFTL